MLLAEIDESIYQYVDDASVVAPSDIYNNNILFTKIAKAEFPGSDQPDGDEVKGVSKELGCRLRVRSLNSQTLIARIVQLAAGMPDLAKKLSASADAVYEGEALPLYYDRLLDKMRSNWLSYLRDHVVDASMVGNWINSANRCAATCPAHRPPREETELRFFRPEWEHDGPASEPCADARYCGNSVPSWSRLSKRLEERYDARFARDLERASDMVREMPRGQT